MRLNRSVRLALVMCVAVVLLASCSRPDSLSGTAGQIPIQNKGRIKAMDVFARETVRQLTGKETWQGAPAIKFIFDILARPEAAGESACIRVDYKELKRLLGLPENEKYFSSRRLEAVFPKVMSLLQTSQDKRGQGQRPTVLESKAEMLYTQILLLESLSSGRAFTVIPPAQGKVWESLARNSGELAAQFGTLVTLYASGSAETFSGAVAQWNARVGRLSPEPYQNQILRESWYYQLKPFQWSWTFYLVSFVLLSGFSSRRSWRALGLAFFGLGVVCHSAGLLLRVMILERPPVSNMYESMIFMNWILIVTAGGYYLIKRRLFFLTTGALVSALVMIFANLLPVSQSMDMLAPVLRSNYWLALHVLTIVASYGLFGLTMALGHRHLFLSALRKLDGEASQVSAQTMTRLMQLGLLTLGAGTVLGGIWANESWGRFWGWDPKETWSLITFLGYMLILHLRYARKLTDFGLAAGALAGFLLVMMTWYGVNFLLGKGLHSYGAGTGGLIWIMGYLILEAAFLMFVFSKRKN